MIPLLLALSIGTVDTDLDAALALADAATRGSIESAALPDYAAGRKDAVARKANLVLWVNCSPSDSINQGRYVHCRENSFQGSHDARVIVAVYDRGSLWMQGSIGARSTQADIDNEVQRLARLVAARADVPQPVQQVQRPAVVQQARACST